MAYTEQVLFPRDLSMPPIQLLEMVLLSIIQGVGEFLPISSSGHIVVLETLFEQRGLPSVGEKMTVNIVLHVGTLLAILVFYWRRILALIGSDRRVLGLLFVGSLPTVAVGLLVKSQFEEVFETALVAGFAFPLTGLMLLMMARFDSGTVICRDLSYGRAFLIGISQAIAIVPGISRSGATIVTGLSLGLRREDAATFSFLLAIPAIGGAGLLKTISLLSHPTADNSISLLLIGGMVSFLVGLASLWWLIRWLERGRLHYFAWWVLLLGPVVIVWQLFFS